MLRKRLEPGQSYFDTIKSDKTEYLEKKKMVISDCDGVLTDGNAIYTEDGKVGKIYGAYDTEMISFMKTQGWDFKFVSKDNKGWSITKARVQGDMRSDLFNIDGKERANLVKAYEDDGYSVLFVGDSLSDIQAMSEATYAACPNNAVEICKDYVDFVSSLDGGHGAFGDILMWIHKILTK